MANLEIIFYIPNRFTTFFFKRYTALSFKTDMTARFCACNENKAASAKKNYGYSLQDGVVCGDAGRWECAPTSGWIAFLGVFSTHYMAEVGGYRFVGLVRIWTKIGLFCGPKAK